MTHLKYSGEKNQEKFVFDKISCEVKICRFWVMAMILLQAWKVSSAWATHCAGKNELAVTWNADKTFRAIFRAILIKIWRPS